MARRIDGAVDLERKLKALSDPRTSVPTLRQAVRTPIQIARQRASQNIHIVSPGKTLRHRTYLKRWVWRGFASRNIRTLAGVRADNLSAFALLGVRAEAFYAINFFELGTSKIPKRPWLVPAFRDSRESMLSAMAEVWRARIARIAGSGARLT